MVASWGILSGQHEERTAKWDGGKEIAFKRHDGVVVSVAFSPDGKRVASASYDEVKLWDVATGKERLKFKPSRKMVFTSVAISPDGRTLAGGQCRIKERKESSKGDLLLTTFIYNGGVMIWDIQTGRLKAALNDDDNSVWTLAFSPNGDWLAVGSGPNPQKDSERKDAAIGEVMLWDTRSWKLIRKLKGNAAPVRSLAFSPDNRMIIGAGGVIEGWGEGSVEGKEEFELLLWDVASGELKHAFPGHLQSVTGLAFSPDGRWLASAGRDRWLKIWDIQTYQLKRGASDHKLSLEEIQTIQDAAGGKGDKQAILAMSWLNAILFSNDGNEVIGGAGNGTIRFYDADSLEITQVTKPRDWPIVPHVFSVEPIEPGGYWRTFTRWPVYYGLLNSMALAPDGKTLAVGTADGKVRLMILE
jgi:WD40 repeat protein